MKGFDIIDSVYKLRGDDQKDCQDTEESDYVKENELERGRFEESPEEHVAKGRMRVQARQTRLNLLCGRRTCRQFLDWNKESEKATSAEVELDVQCWK